MYARLHAVGWAAFVIILAGGELCSARAADEPAGAPPFHIQAHRGAGIDYPENTLEAFEKSWNMHVTPEADLRTTADGVIVCFHDADFSRVARGISAERKTLGVEDLTLKQLATIDVGSFRGEQYAGERIPALREVFAEMKGRPERLLYLDVKVANLDLEKLAALIRQYDVASQIIFTTKHHDLIRDWKRRVPDSLTLIWNGGSEQQLRQRLEAIRKADFQGITHLQIHVKVGDLESDEPFVPSIEFLEATRDELKRRGIVFQVLPWKCKDPRAYRRLLELGAESFATDYPAMTVDVVRDYLGNGQTQ